MECSCGRKNRDYYLICSETITNLPQNFCSSKFPQFFNENTFVVSTSTAQKKKKRNIFLRLRYTKHFSYVQHTHTSDLNSHKRKHTASA